MSSTSIPPTTIADSTTGKTQVHAGDYTTPRSEHPSHHKESDLSEKFEKLEEELRDTTNDAVAEGQEDVTQATASYLEKALHLADTGLAAAQSYVGAGKERLQAPHQGEHPPASLTASLAATAASALDAAGGYLGLAQQKIHEQHQSHHASTGPAHPVTSSTKPIGQALQDNVTAAQETVQPHIDAAYATAKPHVDAVQEKVQPYVDAAQPHIDSAKAVIQPHVDAATSGLQSQVEYAKQAWNDEKPLTQQAQEAAQPHVDAAKRAASDVMNSDRSLMQQAQDAASSLSGSNATTEVPSKPVLGKAGETHGTSVEPVRPGPEYPREAGSLQQQAVNDSKLAADSGFSATKQEGLTSDPIEDFARAGLP